MDKARFERWTLILLLGGLVASACAGDPPDIEEVPPAVEALPAEPPPEPQKLTPPKMLVSPVGAGLPQELQRIEEPRFGDFTEMAERRLIRLLTVYRLGGYFLDGPQERGTTYEAARAFEQQINKKLGRRHLKAHVVILPVDRDELIPALLQGYGDIAAANLTITPEREELVQFSDPLMRNVSELVVTGPAAPPIASLDELGGLQIHVRRSSSYWDSLTRLNERLRSEGKPPAELVPTSENLEDVDLIEMVNAGLLSLVVVDSHKARFWAQVFDEIEVREDLALRTGARIAWAFRKESPELQAVVNEFVRTHREGTLLGNVVLNRYLKQTRWVRNALVGEGLDHFHETIDLFKRYGDQYGFEHLMVAAQGYQESGLDQSRRSRAGAIGVMQVLPATAADPRVDIPDIEQLENNIHAGVKYLHFIRSHYFDDPAISEADRVLLSFAAYNAGPTRVRRLRTQAAELGLDPNRWFDNVEVVAAREIGRETVQYVGNICKYYLAYGLLEQKRTERERSRQRMSGSP